MIKIHIMALIAGIIAASLPIAANPIEVKKLALSKVHEDKEGKKPMTWLQTAKHYQNELFGGSVVISASALVMYWLSRSPVALEATNAGAPHGPFARERSFAQGLDQQEDWKGEAPPGPKALVARTVTTSMSSTLMTEPEEEVVEEKKEKKEAVQDASPEPLTYQMLLEASVNYELIDICTAKMNTSDAAGDVVVHDHWYQRHQVTKTRAQQLLKDHPQLKAVNFYAGSRVKTMLELCEEYHVDISADACP